MFSVQSSSSNGVFSLLLAFGILLECQPSSGPFPCSGPSDEYKKNTSCAEPSALLAGEVDAVAIKKVQTPPCIDGKKESIWTSAEAHPMNNVLLGTVTPDDLSGSWKALWDDDNLYLWIEITDDKVSMGDSGEEYWQDDTVEVFTDGNNSKGTSYDADDIQFFFRFGENQAYRMDKGDTTKVKASFVQIEKGYHLEVSFAWSTLGVTPKNQQLLGFDVHVDDDDDGNEREAKKAWNATVDDCWSTPSLFGTLRLTAVESDSHDAGISPPQDLAVPLDQAIAPKTDLQLPNATVDPSANDGGIDGLKEPYYAHRTYGSCEVSPSPINRPGAFALPFLFLLCLIRFFRNYRA